MGFEDFDTPITSARPDKAIWNVDPELFCDDDLKMIDTGPETSYTARHFFRPETLLDTGHPPRYDQSLRHYHGWRLCQYLPLEFDGHYATGLSIYSDGNGIQAIVAHGQSPSSSRIVGTRRGPESMPLYFHFRPGERLTFLALCTSNIELVGVPFLMVSSCLLRALSTEQPRLSVV